MATVSDLPYMSDGEYGYYRFNAAIKSAYDYYPFGSLKPGRYTSDTSSNCVTLTQNKWVTKYRTDSVWVNHTLVVRQAPTLLNVNTIANEVVAEANGQGSRITFTGVAGANAIAQAVIPTTVSAGVLQELTLSTVTYDSNMVLSVTEEVNGKEIVLHTGVLAPLMSDAGAQLSTISILPQTSNVKVKIGPAYILTPGTTAVVDGYWKKVTTPYQEQEQILVTLCDSVGDQYRFGFNGMEKDNELKGVGNSLDFGARMYDSRLGRWLSLDPLAAKYPSISPYAFVANSPLMFIDPDGKRIVFSNRDDAALFHNNVNSIFPGAKFDDFRNLLTRGSKNNKLAFDKIDNIKLEASIKNLSTKEQHLAKMYASAINEKRDITVKYYSNTDKIEGRDYELLYNSFTDNGRMKDAVTLANSLRKSSVTFDQNGNAITTYYFTGDVLNARDGGITIQDGNDALVFLNKQSADLDVKTGHEAIGHGLPLIKGGYTKDQNDDHAVQTENLIRDVSGKGGQIDGTQHNDQQRPTSNPNDLPK